MGWVSASGEAGPEKDCRHKPKWLESSRREGPHVSGHDLSRLPPGPGDNRPPPCCCNKCHEPASASGGVCGNPLTVAPLLQHPCSSSAPAIEPSIGHGGSRRGASALPAAGGGRRLLLVLHVLLLLPWGGSISSNASSSFSPSGQLEYLLGDGPFAAPDGGAASASPATTAHACTGSAAERAQRIAFRTRSAIEILDDGYKWRKYGRKAVKNSPNPRNYYRCSTEACDVKKRVERDRDDSAYVVTTYEGTHSHASPSTVYYASHDAASGRFFIAGTHPPLDELAVIVTSDH